MKPTHIIAMATAILSTSVTRAIDRTAFSLLADRDAITARIQADPPLATAADLASYDAGWTTALGEGWLARMEGATKTQDGVLADIYCEGRDFLWGWDEQNPEVATQLMTHIAARKTLTTFDMLAVGHLASPGNFYPDIARRVDELLALRLAHAKGVKQDAYFHYKYYRVLGMGGEWTAYLTPAEWLELSTGDYGTALYQEMRDNLMAMVMNALIRKREKNGKPVEGPEFDKAMEPIVAAFGAPMFEGLQAATDGLNIDLPVMDYTATLARVNGYASAIERHAVSEADAARFLGSIMFVKGVTAYNAWKDLFTAENP